MSAARDLVMEAFRTEEHGLDWRAGVAGALASVGPLAIGLASGESALGLIAAIGGLNVALCVPAAGLRSRLWWGSLGALGQVGALVLADLVRDHDWAVVAATLLWVSTWALARAGGRAGAITGFATAAVFVVIAGIPASPEPFGERTALVLARHGGGPRPDGRRPPRTRALASSRARRAEGGAAGRLGAPRPRGAARAGGGREHAALPRDRPRARLLGARSRPSRSSSRASTPRACEACSARPARSPARR